MNQTKLMNLNWDTFVDLPQGSRIHDTDGTIYVKVEQRYDMHLNGQVVNLNTGQVKHVSRLQCFRDEPSNTETGGD